MAGKGSQRLEKKALPRVETAEKSRMAGKRLAKLEKKALPRVETAEKSRMAGKRLAKVEKKALPRVELGFFRLRRRLRRAALSVDGVHRWHQPSRIDRRAGI